MSQNAQQIFCGILFFISKMPQNAIGFLWHFIARFEIATTITGLRRDILIKIIGMSQFKIIFSPIYFIDNFLQRIKAGTLRHVDVRMAVSSENKKLPYREVWKSMFLNLCLRGRWLSLNIGGCYLGY